MTARKPGRTFWENVVHGWWALWLPSVICIPLAAAVAVAIPPQDEWAVIILMLAVMLPWTLWRRDR